MVSTVVVGWGRWKYGRSSPIESLGSSNCKRGAVRRYLLGANAIGGRLAVEVKILFVAAESMVLQTNGSFRVASPSPAFSSVHQTCRKLTLVVSGVPELSSSFT